MSPFLLDWKQLSLEWIGEDYEFSNQESGESFCSLPSLWTTSSR